MIEIKEVIQHIQEAGIFRKASPQDIVKRKRAFRIYAQQQQEEVIQKYGFKGFIYTVHCDLNDEEGQWAEDANYYVIANSPEGARIKLKKILKTVDKGIKVVYPYKTDWVSIEVFHGRLLGDEEIIDFVEDSKSSDPADIKMFQTLQKYGVCLYDQGT